MSQVLVSRVGKRGAIYIPKRICEQLGIKRLLKILRGSLRRSKMSSTPLKVLLDSTYILPSFEIEVEGLSIDHIAQLREAGIKGRVKFYCLSVVWVEV